MKLRALLAAMPLLCLAVSADAEPIVGLTNLQELVTFDSATRTVTSTVSLLGFSLTGEIALSIDFRPATGQLYALSNRNNVYSINTTSGARTLVASAVPVSGTTKSIDFNPTVDRLRVAGSGGSNVRVNVDTGAATVDGVHAFAPADPNSGDTPAVVNVAYTNSVAGATTTTLFALDAFNDVLATQAPPNDGRLNTVGALGFDVVPSSGFTGFDISGKSGVAYVTGNKLGSGGLTANSLYALNLGTGALSNLGAISGINGSLRDIAVRPVPEPMSLGLLTIGLVYAVRRRSAR